MSFSAACEALMAVAFTARLKLGNTKHEFFRSL